ncbi:post-GPI attachment to proteins factor 6 [Vanessa cardui]|uniref:post-GPI attachment to proteins factor 6 n=1 Tax=Vanessa cardui TaxID=171605 RepID=UPI001F13BBA8|nr:post-GPI attachment to proteins factor 6 [Vanessa cardui]
MKSAYLLVFLICYVACNSDKEAEIEDKKKKIIEQLTNTRPVIKEGYQLVTRHVGIDVYMYRSYRTVSVVFYPVINDISDALFTFQSEELHLNNIGSCSPRDVIIHLKYGSYPAVNPDGYSFPKSFIDADRRENMYTVELLSDGNNITFSIKNPKPGIWYALAYIKWEDPRTQKVEQEGLVADCHTILYTDLQLKSDDTSRYMNCYKPLSLEYETLPTLFKCKSEDNLKPIKLDLNIATTTVPTSKITVRVQSESSPTEDNFILFCVFDPSVNNNQVVTFHAYPNAVHFINLDIIDGNTSNITDCDSYATSDLDETDNQTLVSLMRDDKDRFFAFDYGLPTTDLQDVTSLVNLSSNEIRSMRFEINQFIDIGGSLTIETSLLMSLKYYMGYKRELKKGALLAFTEENQFFKVVVCLDISHASVPLESGHCKFNDRIKPALFVLNSTDSESIYDKVIIPFPEGALWYLTFRLFCDSVVCPCRTSHNGTRYYVDTTENSGEIDSTTFSNVTREGETECNATVVLSISSNSCVNGRCSNHGNCGINTFSGLVMSFCSCSSGYGGWDCSDESRVDSHFYMLLAVLLLTLSNLLFLFSIYVATIRFYFVEAVMYLFTMLFSTFYHACDAPAQIAYCIMRGNMLQFGDFYCGLMSFWVTLLAMSIISLKLRSFLQIIGAIIIALLTTWNMHSFVAFLTPVACGAFILLVSWYVDYKQTKQVKYPRSYYTTYMPLGIALVSVGLICYAFLQTEQNYKIVHSIWHMIIAISVVFLLPDVKRHNVNPFLPDRDLYSSPFWKVLNRRDEP